jgi:hypothetical protein
MGTALFTHGRDQDLDSLLGGVRSASYCPKPGQDGHDGLMAALREAFSRNSREGRVRIEYDCVVYWGSLGL